MHISNVRIRNSIRKQFGEECSIIVLSKSNRNRRYLDLQCGTKLLQVNSQGDDSQLQEINILVGDTEIETQVII